MDAPEYDPRVKQQIKDALYAHLYDPVTRQFKGRIDTLIERNTIMGGHGHRHFIYKGVLYSSDPTSPPLRKNRLVPQLKVPMDEYLADLARLNNEELPFVLGFINQVLNSSTGLTDYLRVLPESIHAPLKKLMGACPCRVTHLDEDRVDALRAKNAQPIQLMKNRLVTNLLI